MRGIDELDEKVLACLTRDARATYAQIGDEVGLSAPAVKRRVDRLVDDGVIKGFTTVVDPAAMQWTTEAYVQIFCRGNISPEILKESWEPIQEVVSAATITGQADAILRIMARDVHHLEQALERIRQAGGVDRTESIIVLSHLIDRGHP
ncbi:Lrp/AsnC family transcriptional regulator [Gordonia polyisoprenivorans]|uniref:Lrp/AsnC family transcriptional regulator n=1 Tax=Gordonia polyisoprenivorans TaxID=84595 RepID=UPI000B99F23B|nr:Lrp/AsnC family transcriptional regulator [Gordonia polyisoprenivorans]OZC29700.1 AsnC family transcriptional regulator [Gordonia polyisoprenivorans]QUD81349.1 Lrp/AsnC family transcriptional regulator [Gordonia polyisoprenivorans]UZF58017.1 Lrp/AsnC family transcriptional regulator [Gordonia polyisoprenivorans]